MRCGVPILRSLSLVPPMHDVQLEQSLLGAVLMRNDLLPAIAEKVKAADFFEAIHSTIFEICSTMINMGKLANPLTIKPFLPAKLTIGELNVSQYLARLAAESCTANEAPHLAGVIRDLADRRTIAGVGEQLRATQADPSELASWGVEELDRIAVSRSTKATPSVSAGESAARALDSIARAYQLDGAITGISYGLPELDAKTSGLQRGELTILAGRPGMMKSGSALAFARRMSEAGHPGMFFSLEMKDEQLTRRIFSDLIFEMKEVPYNRMRSGRVSEAEFTLIRDAALMLESWPLQIEQDDVSLSQIASRARQRKRKHGLDYLIVDHIGHIQSADRYRGNKNLELSEISGGLMRLARELDIGVLALSQLARAVEGRDNKRPTLADLRDSGSLEQDAATVMFVYRESYYLQNQEPRAGTPEHEIWQDRMLGCMHDLEIIIQKQRDGPVGSVKAYVNPGCNAVRSAGWTRDVWQETESFAF